MTFKTRLRLKNTMALIEYDDGDLQIEPVYTDGSGHLIVYPRFVGTITDCEIYPPLGDNIYAKGNWMVCGGGSLRIYGFRRD
jgi:hypothetical protein